MMTSQTEQGQWFLTGGFGRHGSQWVNLTEELTATRVTVASYFYVS